MAAISNGLNVTKGQHDFNCHGPAGCAMLLVLKSPRFIPDVVRRVSDAESRTGMRFVTIELSSTV